jgi:hypothetical protein
MTERHHGARSELSRLFWFSRVYASVVYVLTYICALQPIDVASDNVYNASESTSLVVSTSRSSVSSRPEFGSAFDGRLSH